MPRPWILLTLAAAMAGCAGAPAPVASPTPGPAGGASVAESATPPAPRPTPDVAFVAGMIAHHAQALEMTRLVPARGARPEVRLIAERIEASQEDEIGLMRRWLARRGQDTAATHAHHAGHAMPGMATAEEMGQLAATAGPAFDRRFLELMIRHHEGALRMVADLLAAPRGADDPELFRLAADVDADQRAEIRRMREVLAKVQQ